MKIFNKNRIRNLVIVLCLFVFPFNLVAQQQAQFTHFMYHSQNYNPAFVGLYQNKSLLVSYRKQWIGIEGAPKTQTFSYGGPTKLKGLGFGIGVINDQIGPTSKNTFDLDFSYAISISKSSHVAFGIKGSANILNVNFNLLNPDNSIGMDPTLINNIDNQVSPNVGAGILYYNNTFYAGLSVPSLLETIYFQKSSVSISQEKMHFYFTSGLVKEISSNIKFRPSLIIKAVAGSPIQTDIGVAFLLAKKVSLAVSYRVNTALSGLVGYQFSKPFFIGLSYDKATTNLGQDISGRGSVEVVMRYVFIKKSTSPAPDFMF